MVDNDIVEELIVEYGKWMLVVSVFEWIWLLFYVFVYFSLLEESVVKSGI